MKGPVSQQRLLHALLVVLGVVALVCFLVLADAVIAEITSALG